MSGDREDMKTMRLLQFAATALLLAPGLVWKQIGAPRSLTTKTLSTMTAASLGSRSCTASNNATYRDIIRARLIFGAQYLVLLLP